MNLPLELSLEQKFNLEMYKTQVKSLTAEEAQELLLNVMYQLMVKENAIRHLMKHGMGDL
jgi:hypothetical protein